MTHPTLALKSAYLALRRALEHTVKPFGFSGGQFDVLQVLMHEPELEHRELQKRLAVTSPTLSNVLDGLERNGHVVRQASGHDARVKNIAITDSARRVCYSKAFCDAGDQLVETMFKGFTAQERKIFTQHLARMQKNLEEIGA
jgi:DNA-binding MarR family transcriptional regulator